METNRLNWQPAWTTAVKIESGGRYPLGLNRFHNGLEEMLIKSITFLASRLRYYTYSCWVIGDIERHDSCQNWADFVQAFQRRETALTTGFYLLQPGYSFPGSDRVSEIVGTKETEGAGETVPEAESYRCDYSIMKSNDLGAFGLYYAGTAYALGLIEYNEKGIAVLTPAGKELYQIAEERYRRHRPAYYTQYRGQSTVPGDVLREWSLVNGFDNIRDPECQAERVFFQSLLFRLNRDNSGDYRRDTLAFFLACIRHCDQAGIPFDEDVLRHIHTYRCYQRGSDEIVAFPVPKVFEDVHFYWSIYEGHVYFRGWLSRVFRAFLYHLKGCPNGATLEDFLNEVNADSFNEAITYFCGTETNWLEGEMGAILDQISGPSDLTDLFSEAQLTTDTQFDSLSGIMAKFVLVMAALWQRFKVVRTDRRYQTIAVNLSSDLWFDVLFHLPKLRQMPASRFLRFMLKSYVINQHDRIMIEKNDLRRCWFTTEKGRYFFQADASIIWRPAKYDTIMNFLSDMYLITASDGKQWRLTTEGEALLQKVIGR